ncbi:MAG: aldo/keto reductase [Candidatus Omnitrophota bacterium]|jgi:aryl-alcohol dehydrogenase-like predicted oxidoreductase|nr:MAG: aldo/keto reductase [Candidatus Omnitrophota bacterium]
MKPQSRHTRRTFLKQTTAAVLTTTVSPICWPAATGDMPLRLFGKTGENVSLLGLGGFHIGTVREDNEAVRLVREAIDLGVTFMDNAWEYLDGRSEEIMGKALADGYRKKVFLMTKHHGRDKKTAMQHLEDSLRRLQTDVIDLWQFHEIVYEKDADMIFADGGGIEAAVEAKKTGKVRYIGFTGHKDPKYLLAMLDHEFAWDAAQMPLSVLDAHFRSFEASVLPICQKRGMAALGMKSQASGILLRTNTATTQEALTYAMNLPVATVISGMNSFEHLRANIEIARNFKPLTEEERKKILDKTKEVAADGQYEPFKTTNRFDGPIGRKLHGVQ